MKHYKQITSQQRTFIHSSCTPRKLYKTKVLNSGISVPLGRGSGYENQITETYHIRPNALQVAKGSGCSSQINARSLTTHSQHNTGVIPLETLKDILISKAEHVLQM